MARGTLVIAFLTLTLAISAATTTFSIVDAVALRRLPFPDDDRLVAIARVSARNPQPGVVAPQDYLGWRDGTTAFAALGATAGWRASRLPMMEAGETLTTRRMTANFFDVLGVSPMIGRSFTPDEELEGATPLVAVISHRLWTMHFAGDPGVLGRSVSLGREERRIVGVMPPGFTYPVGRQTVTDIWIPWVPRAAERDPASGGRGFYLDVVGRLRDGVTLAQAKAEVDRVRDAMAENPRSSWAGTRAHTVPLKDFVIGPAKAWMVLALGAVAAVLLVACANVANLLLVRAAPRQRDLAVRAALGASRGRLVRGVLVESLGLALASAAAGVLVSVWGVDVVRAALPDGVARASDIAINLRVLGAAALAAVATALVCGLAPASQMSRVDVVTLIKGDGAADRTGLRGGTRLRSLLLVAEVALVVMLIVGASLFVTSFIRVMEVDLGFAPDGLVAFPVDVGVKAKDPDEQNETSRVLLAGVIDRVMALPGVAAAGIYEGGRPLGGGGVQYSIEGFGSGRGDDMVEMRAISPGYVDAARMQVLSGRPILASDAVGGPRVALVNDVIASRYFPDRDPVGQRFDFRGPVEIVGVVRAVRAAGPEVDPRPEIFFPLTQHPRNWSAGLPLVVIRIDGALGPVMPALQAALRDVQPQAETARQPFLYAEALGRLTAQRRFSAGLMTVFGVLALVIGAAGVYAVMAFVVGRRTREIGIRIAFGASPSRVIAVVLSEAGRHLAVGLAVGLLAAWILSSGLAAVLFGVSTSEPIVYGVAATIVALVGLMAALIPAIRATGVDPAVTLRVE